LLCLIFPATLCEKRNRLSTALVGAGIYICINVPDAIQRAKWHVYESWLISVKTERYRRKCVSRFHQRLGCIKGFTSVCVSSSYNISSDSHPSKHYIRNTLTQEGEIGSGVQNTKNPNVGLSNQKIGRMSSPGFFWEP
jgi:hypothetical protein